MQAEAEAARYRAEVAEARALATRAVVAQETPEALTGCYAERGAVVAEAADTGGVRGGGTG